VRRTLLNVVNSLAGTVTGFLDVVPSKFVNDMVSLIEMQIKRALLELLLINKLV